MQKNAKGKKTCGSPSFKGDGHCDDNNNNCGCGWDMGDCCGNSGVNPNNQQSTAKTQYNFCNKATGCKCLDPKSKPASGCPNKGKCLSFIYKGDGLCDDDNNNCGCNWDNGDCCGNTGYDPKTQYNYCNKASGCKCLDPKSKPVSGCPNKGKCLAFIYKGDGHCDDENNNCGCNWDNGDCCGNNGNPNQKTYCKVCKCLDPNPPKPSACSKQKGNNPDYVGDGWCDAENNNAGCKYDGGDCCPNSKTKKSDWYKFCGNDCTCKDPKKATCKGKSTCGGSQFFGDGACDDANNNCGCQWDGGDCCGPSVVKTYCTVCKCQDPKIMGNMPVVFG